MISSETFARYAAMHVPRYTSYPTAPHFSPAIGQAAYRAWLRQVPAQESISIYLHVPFCKEMCWYCGCHTTVAHRPAPIVRYVNALSREIELIAAELPPRLRVAHIHWGGGSPTLLPPKAIAELSHQLRQVFDVGPEAEIAVEIDPRSLSEEAAGALGRSEITRASIGVQCFDPEVQAAINRKQSFAETQDAVDLLRRNGVAAINVDLVYGLPLQTVSSCIHTVKRALCLRPDRFAVFGYAHVPEFKPHQRKISGESLPGAVERREQFHAIASMLVGMGYARIGLDHFALPDDPLAKAAEAGKLRRNFQGYTTDLCSTLLGFGASAIGKLPQGYVQNAVRIPDYEQRIGQGRLAVTRGYRLSDDDRRRAAIIEQLMCTCRADISGVDAPLGEFEADGLIRRSGDLIQVVDQARPLVRTIAAAFDAYLPNSATKHTVAV